MADDQEVVIVDADGTEHVFPPGMDPVKAAAIVRGQSQPTPQRSRTGQMYTSPPMGQGVLDEFGKHFISGLNPVNALKSAGSLVSTAVTDPSEAGRMLTEGIAEPFRAIGRGEIGAGAGDLAAMAAGPMILRGARIPVGKALESTGGNLADVANSRFGRAAGPVAAAYKLAHGDMTGAAEAMVIPPAIGAGGRGLQILGRMIRGKGSAPNVGGVSVEDLRAAGVGESAIKASTQGRSPMPWQQPEPTAPPPTVKTAYTAADFQRFQELKAKGASDRMARQIVDDEKARGNEVYNRR